MSKRSHKRKGTSSNIYDIFNTTKPIPAAFSPAKRTVDLPEGSTSPKRRSNPEAVLLDSVRVAPPRNQESATTHQRAREPAASAVPSSAHNPSPSRPPPQIEDEDEAEDGQQDDMHDREDPLDGGADATDGVKKPRRRAAPGTNNTIAPSKLGEEFMKNSPEAYDCMLERYAPPSTDDLCFGCYTMFGRKRTLPEKLRRYRCEDCIDHPDFCAGCAKIVHTMVPWHHLWKWSDNDQTWIPTTSTDIGVVIRIGHKPWELCEKPQAKKTPLTVVHERGIIEKVDFQHCACSRQTKSLKFLRVGLFPGSWSADGSPRTLYTVRALEMFDAHLFQAQSSVHEIFLILRRLSNRVLPFEVSDRERELFRALREYGFLEACIYHGYRPGSGSVFNALVTLCAACPHPGKNMRLDWELRDKLYEYLDDLVLETDGHFKHFSRPKPRDDKEQPFTKEISYLGNGNDLQTHLAKVGKTEKEPSNCNNFKATGYTGHVGNVTGIVAVFCRHGAIIGGSVMNLNKGESLASALRPFRALKRVRLYYDVACSLAINLDRRLDDMEEYANEIPSITPLGIPTEAPPKMVRPRIDPTLGQFHINAHKDACHTVFNPAMREGAGHTGGEEGEQDWALLAPLSTRTKEMNPASREDTLSRAADNLNINKSMILNEAWLTLNPDKYLGTMLEKAEETRAEMKAFIDSLEAKIDKRHLTAWRKELNEWYDKVVDVKNHDDLENPFVMNVDPDLSFPEAASDLRTPAPTPPKNTKVTKIVAAIVAAIDLHDARGLTIAELAGLDPAKRTLRKRAMQKAQTVIDSAQTVLSDYERVVGSLLHAAIHDRATSVDFGSPEGWPYAEPIEDLESRVHHCDVVEAQAVEDISDVTVRQWAEQVAAIQVPLPSLLHPSLRQHPHLQPMALIERQLREAQAEQALDNVRKSIVLTASLNDLTDPEASKPRERTFRNRHAKPREHPAPQEMHLAVKTARAEYHRLRNILCRLGMKQDDDTFRVLQSRDLRHFTVLHCQRNAGDSHHPPGGWLWRTVSWAKSFDQKDQKAFAMAKLKVLWFRASTGWARWDEEANIRLEEMFRTREMWAYQRTWWSKKGEEEELSGSLGAATRRLEFDKLWNDADDRFPKTINQTQGLGMPRTRAKNKAAK
ncbi:uncharacterized protein BXZ73DRAFT_82076 [Epithele typhae]|uniref:uncharacterized protein n=1 Tax=Epithele typhae TaxID=378194 RepID=UPI002007A5C9|nr:uncharacterized protein BXZ73DRAFT_82076 [Epithele typhae]KAH9912986.1 hypothetical protein BXZ73DRAFT_82076 [Epithele typhae]